MAENNTQLECPDCGCPATHPSGLCRDCHQAVLERDTRACVNLPVSLGWSREEIKETLPFLEDSQIEEIISAAYELQVTFDLGLKKFVSVRTVTHYRPPAGAL